MRVSEEIVKEIQANAEKIDAIKHGKIAFIIQDGRVMRVVVEDGWQPRRAAISQRKVG